MEDDIIRPMEPNAQIPVPEKHFINRVTPFSKALALILFIALPLITLYFGYHEGKKAGSVSQSETAVVTEAVPISTTEGQVSNINSAAQCPTSNFSVDDSPPVITSITPSSGPTGTTIEITGCNFLSFEGDKEVWFVNSRGEKGFLNGQMDDATRASNTVTRVTLQQKLCQINSYSGLDCPVLELTPGVYTVYANSYGGKSNTVNFTVTER